MTPDDVIYRRRLALLREVERTGNVAEDRRRFGVSRTRYCDWRRRAEHDGLEALMPKARRRPQVPGTTPTHALEEGSAPSSPDIPSARSPRAGRMPRCPGVFPKEFKDDVVRVTRSGKFTHEEVAHDFNISTSSVKRWLLQANIDDGLRGGLTSTEQEEVVQLLRDNQRLTMENEILRCAAAYVAKDALPQ